MNKKGIMKMLYSAIADEKKIEPNSVWDSIEKLSRTRRRTIRSTTRYGARLSPTSTLLPRAHLPQASTRQWK